MRNRCKEEIEIDFNRAVNQAQEIEDMAMELGSIANSNMDESMIVLRKCFAGANGNAITNIGGEIGLGLLRAADDLMSVARNIRQTSKIIYNAEIEGICLFD